MGFRGGGQIDPPPGISWFSSTPAGIELIDKEFLLDLIKAPSFSPCMSQTLF